MNKNPDLVEAENNPNSGHYYKKLGNELYQQGKYKDAIENYTKAIVMILEFPLYSLLGNQRHRNYFLFK